jgi:hypothetical protein
MSKWTVTLIIAQRSEQNEEKEKGISHRVIYTEHLNIHCIYIPHDCLSIIKNWYKYKRIYTAYTSP